MSNEKQETVADVVAAMRKDIDDGTVGIWSDFGGEIARGYADRIEAAMRNQFRDVKKMIPHEEVAVSKMETTTPTSEKSSAVGNAAAMREALEQIHELLSIGWKPDTAMCIRYEAAYQIAKEALAAPPRNCDVGNEKDQSDRLDAFCAKHFQYGDDSPCSQCPVAEGKDQSLPCVFRFLQLPYEKKAK